MNTQADFSPVTELITVDAGAPTAELMAETDMGWLWMKLAESRVMLSNAVEMADDCALTDEAGEVRVIRPQQLRAIGAL